MILGECRITAQWMIINGYKWSMSMPFLRGIADLGLEALDFCGLHRVNVVADLRKKMGKAERRISEHTTCKATTDNRFSNDRKHLTVFDTNFNSVFLAPTPIPYKRCFNTLQITLWWAGVAFTAAVFASHPRLRVVRLSICKYWWGFNLTNGWEPCATSKRMHGRLPFLHSTWLCCRKPGHWRAASWCVNLQDTWRLWVIEPPRNHLWSGY